MGGKGDSVDAGAACCSVDAGDEGGAGAGLSLRNLLFLLRTAHKDSPKGPPTANGQPLTANGQPLTANNRQPSTTANPPPPPPHEVESPPTPVPQAHC